MKKYFLFLVTVFSLLISSFFSAPSALAASQGGDGATCHDDFDCLWDYYCRGGNTGSFADTGVCRKRIINDCHCEHPGDPDDKQNGFTCAGNTLYCKKTSWVCNDDLNNKYPDSEGLPHDKINFDGHTDYESHLIYSVSCQEEDAFPVACKCVNQGNKRGFTCELKTGQNPGDVDKRFTAKGLCPDETQCSQVGFNDPYNGDKEIVESTLDQDVSVYGIDCKRPVADCHCAPKDGKDNRFICELNGETAADTCDDPDFACIDDADAILRGGEGTEDNIFNHADLKGIRCEDQSDKPDPTLPPPQPPPCATDIKDGHCDSFFTAFGKIATNPSAFLQTVFGLLLAISGGIALLLIMRAGYILMTSAGNPDRVKAGREQLVAAIVGLLFIIFSFVILQVIGVEILRLPDFTQSVQAPGAEPGAPGGACTTDADCTAAGNVCISGICRIPVPTTLPSGPCTQVGGTCTSSGLCRGNNGSIHGNPGCSQGKVCCFFH